MVVAKTPPLRETPEEEAAVEAIRAAPIRVALAATLAVVAEVGAGIAPPIPPPEGVVEAAGTAPQIRAALVTVEVVEATRAEEETLPTRAPRAAPTTRLTTSPTIRPPAPWTRLTTRPPT